MPRLQQLDTERRLAEGRGRDHSEALERGLQVLLCFGEGRRAQTLSEVAGNVGLPRATARRALLTLQALGYVAVDGRQFVVTPRVLRLAAAYLTSNAVSTLLQPACDRIAETVGASCSAAVLDRDEVVMIARALPSQLIPVGVGVGFRLPAYCSALGRILLAALPEAELEAALRRSPLAGLTPFTLTDIAAVRDAIGDARRLGSCFVNQEAELGFCSVAVPLRRFDGLVVAALNIGAPIDRYDVSVMTGSFLQLLSNEASALSGALI